MACRGCSSDGCSCSVAGDGAGISVSGTGTPITDPYIVNFIIEDALADVPVDTSDCTDLINPLVPVLLDDGSVVMSPLPCYDYLDSPIPGQAFAFTWNGATGTSPGDGFISFNNASIALTDYIYVSTQDVNGNDITDWGLALDDITGSPKGMFRIYMRSDVTVWATFRLFGATAGDPDVTDFYVGYVDHNGAFDDALVGDIVLDFAPASEGSIGGFDSVQDIRTVTGADTLVLADQGKYLRCGNASPFSLTVPTNASVAFPPGTHIDLIQSGAGQVTVAAAGGVTINAAPGLKLDGQWAAATLVKVATDEWDLVGNLTA